MDRKRRKPVVSFWIRVFISLIIFAVTYLSVIRPIQQSVINNLIFPILKTYNNKNGFEFFPGSGDDIFAYQPFGKSSIKTKLELPFNGHILLALTLLLASGNKRFTKFLVYYQLSLFLIIPFLGYLLINGQTWLSIAINVHEKTHKVVFLLMGLLSLKLKSDTLSST